MGFGLWVLVWIGVGVLTFFLSSSCGGAIVWASGGLWCGLALEGLGFLSHGVCGDAVVWVRGGYVLIGGDGFAVGVVGGGWSQSHIDWFKIFFLLSFVNLGGLVKWMF